MQQIYFTGNLERDGNTTIIFVFEKEKKRKEKRTNLDFSQGSVGVL